MIGNDQSLRARRRYWQRRRNCVAVRPYPEDRFDDPDDAPALATFIAIVVKRLGG
jgi:hypothetical protein